LFDWWWLEMRLVTAEFSSTGCGVDSLAPIEIDYSEH
jgi:hypothetical protein